MEQMVERMVALCDCDWTYHRGQACPNAVTAAGNHQLCTPCLYVCLAERNDPRDLGRLVPDPPSNSMWW